MAWRTYQLGEEQTEQNDDPDSENAHKETDKKTKQTTVRSVGEHTNDGIDRQVKRTNRMNYIVQWYE